MATPTTEENFVSIFWDYENCCVPKGVPGYQVVRVLRQYLQQQVPSLVIRDFIAIGNSQGLNSNTQLELEESGVTMSQVSSSKPNASDIGILGAIMKLIYFQKPPYTIALISGDRDFSKILNFLESVHFNVILIHADNISEVLRNSAKHTIRWRGLFEEENHVSTNRTFAEIAKSAEGNNAPVKLDRIRSKLSAKQFGELVQLLESEPKKVFSLSELGAAIPQIHSKHGFKNMKEYIFAASSAGLIKLINSNAANGNILVGRRKVMAFSPKLKREVDIPRFATLLEYMQYNGEALIEGSKLGSMWANIVDRCGHQTFKEYVLSMEKLGLVTVEYGTAGSWMIGLADSYRIERNGNGLAQFSLRNESCKGRVVVVGSWNGWSEEEELQKVSNDKFYLQKVLPIGYHEYKYKIEDEWMLSSYGEVTECGRNHFMEIV
jgi:uncharacterized LabA/DUF88 family protein